MKILSIRVAAMVLSSTFLQAEDVSFRAEIAPVLLTRCQGCHDATSLEGGYRVDTFERLLRMGDSEASPIVAGKSSESELFRRLISDDPELRMPFEGEPLAAETIDTIRTWIDQGAKFDFEDRSARLASILPITQHPNAPPTYRFKIPITALAFRPGTRELLLGGYHELLAWDLEQSRLVRRTPQVGQRIYGIEVHDDRIYVGSGTPGVLGEVRVFNTNSELLSVPLATSEVVLDLAFSPDRRLLAVGSGDRGIHIIDRVQSRVVRSIGSHSDWVHAVTWNENGSQLASASRDKTAKVFELASGRPVTTYAQHAHDVTGVCFAPGGQQLVSCDATGGIHVWDGQDGKQIRVLEKPSDQTMSLLGDPAGFWVASRSKHLLQFNWTGQVNTWSLGDHDAAILSIAMDDRRQRIATGSFDGVIRVWSLNSGILENEFVPFPMATNGGK